MILCLIAINVFAAPELSDADRERLNDFTTDNDDVLDQTQAADGLYVLLRNASTWQGDDFSGEAGAATAPEPDYDYIKANPEKVRGNVFRLEGWFYQQQRFPSMDNHGREKLARSGDPDWGDQATRWMITTEPPSNEEAASQSWIIVLLNDPDGKITAPNRRAKVAVAARFYKLWTIPDRTGKLQTYPVFVGGATEVIRESASDTGYGMEVILVAIVAVTGAFYIVRRMLNRGGGGNLTQQRLEEIRQKRERMEEAGEDEVDEDLPEDPVEALEVLRTKHESD